MYKRYVILIVALPCVVALPSARALLAAAPVVEGNGLKLITAQSGEPISVAQDKATVPQPQAEANKIVEPPRLIEPGPALPLPLAPAPARMTSSRRGDRSFVETRPAKKREAPLAAKHQSQPSKQQQPSPTNVHTVWLGASPQQRTPMAANTVALQELNEQGPFTLPLPPAADDQQPEEVQPGSVVEDFGYGVHVPPAAGSCSKGHRRQIRFRAYFDYLNLQTRRPHQPFTIDNASGDAIETPYDREDGFRFGAFWKSKCCWDTGIVFTGYDTDARRELIGAANAFQLVQANPELLAGAFASGLGDFAAEEIRLDYDVYDWEIGRTFCPTCGVTLRPFAGVRWSQIDQESGVRYTDGTDFSDTALRSDMDAWGLRGGLESYWNIGGCHLQAFARGSVSVMFAEFDVTRSDRVGQLANPAGAATRNFRSQFERTLPVLDLALGMQYRRGPAFVSVGYELAHWFNMVTQIRPGFDSNSMLQSIEFDRGDVGLAGWFLRVGIER